MKTIINMIKGVNDSARDTDDLPRVAIERENINNVPYNHGEVQNKHDRDCEEKKRKLRSSSGEFDHSSNENTLTPPQTPTRRR